MQRLCLKFNSIEAYKDSIDYVLRSVAGFLISNLSFTIIFKSTSNYKTNELLQFFMKLKF